MVKYCCVLPGWVSIWPISSGRPFDGDPGVVKVNGSPLCTVMMVLSLPTADEVVRQFAHLLKYFLPCPMGSSIDTAENEAVADIRIGQAAIQPDTLEELRVCAKGAAAIVDGF